MSQGFVGTSLNQDFRLKGNKRHNLKIPKILSTRVQPERVNNEFMENFIAEKLAFKSDEILESLILELITTQADPKEIYVQAHEFLQQDTFRVMKEIWEVLVKAQESSLGIPQEMVEKKKEELRLKRLKEEEEDRREQELRKKERDLWEKERQERQNLGGGYGRDHGQRYDDGRGRDFDRGRERERYRDRKEYDSMPSRKESNSRGRDRRRERGRSNSRDRGRGRSFSRDRHTTRPRSNSRDKSSSRERRRSPSRDVPRKKRSDSRDDSRDRYERYARIDRRDHWRESQDRTRNDSPVRRNPSKPRDPSPIRFQRPVAGKFKSNDE